MTSGGASTFICGLLTFLLYALSVSGDDAEPCTTYSAKLESVPDLTHNIVHEERRNPDFVIEDVKSTNYQRSYYWCQLDIKESDTVFKRYRHFGFNSSHWWVEKGCGGWFIVTECRPGDGSGEVTDEDIVVQDKTDDSSSDLGLPVVQIPLLGKLVNNTLDSIKGAAPNPIDAMYESWPKLGYHFPTSEHMWDVIDKATWVDVPEQLGFYKTFRKPRSVAFD